MIYAIYPIMLVTLLWGSKRFKKDEWNEEAFSLRQMKAIQGFAAICIMLHHCGQKVSASWIDKRYYKPGLEFFVPIGYILVTFFTFSSGYGLYKSFKTKENYLKNHFILKRIVPIVALGLVTKFIFLAVRYSVGEPISGKKLLWYLTGAKLCNPYSWYVYIIPLFYLCFFFAFRFIKDEKKALLAVLVFTVAYQVLGACIDHNDWVMRGEWWYNSIHLFVVGIFFARHEKKFVEHIKKHHAAYLVLGILSIVAFTILSEFAKRYLSYYGETWNASFKVLRRIGCLISEILVSSSVVFTAYVTGLKLRVGNRFLDFMGTITLQFYLIHGLFSELFTYAFEGKFKSLYYIKNPLLFVFVVFALGLASAVILKKGEDLIKGIGKRKRSV